MGRYGPEATPVTLVASGVRRQVAITPADDTAIPVTNGLAVNVTGTVAFKDAAGNAASRYMEAGHDYPWEATEISSTGTDVGITVVYALYSQ